MPKRELYSLDEKPLSFTAHKTSKLPAPSGICKKILPMITNVKDFDLYNVDFVRLIISRILIIL